MKTIHTIVSRNSCRIPPRLKLVLSRLGSLILLFQRLPVVQFLFPEASVIGGASVVNTVSLAVTTVVGLGVFDSVAGQSQISQVTPIAVLGKDPAGTSPTAANAINVPATVSAPLTFGFNWDPVDEFSTVKSWRTTYNSVVGSLPPGLSPASVASGISGVPGATQTISGTVTTPGIYPVKVNVYRSTNYGSTTAAQIFNICVLGFSTQPPATTTINSGETTTLTCTAAGIPVATTRHNVTPTVTYQWYSGSSGSGSAISGATGTLTTVSPSASYITPSNLSGSNNYWVKITSTLSGYAVSANSNTAAVNVNPASSPFDSWASGLPVGQNGPTQTPQGDGVMNLEKFAFNMEALTPDVRRLTVGAAQNAGLPGGAMASGKLRIEFLRRKASTNPGITYTAQFGSDLAGWTDIAVGTPVGTPVDETWERVVVDDPTGGTQRFGRVKVQQVP